MKKFLFTLAIMVTCTTINDSFTNYMVKCEIPENNTTCYLFKGFYKGGISCIKN